MAKFRVIVGQFLLKDWTVVKVMLTAVAVGAIGVWAMVGMGMASLHIKPAAFGGVIAGALLFGCGMAIFGYCPGTGVAACGEGRRDAMVGVVGMLCGALAYVAAFPALQGLIKGFGDWGKVTLPQLTGVSPWIFVAALAVMAAAPARLRGAAARSFTPKPPYLMALVFERIQTEGIAELSYLLGDDSDGVAAVFDPTPDVDKYVELAREKKVSITHIFETHIHADLVSGARELCARLQSAKVFASHEGGARYGFDHEELKDGRQVHLRQDGHHREAHAGTHAGACELTRSRRRIIRRRRGAC